MVKGFYKGSDGGTLPAFEFPRGGAAAGRCGGGVSRRSRDYRPGYPVTILVAVPVIFQPVLPGVPSGSAESPEVSVPGLS